MKKLILVLTVMCSLSLIAFAQTTPTKTPETASATTETKKRPPIFRANKAQITEVQKMLKVTETGKMDDPFRDEINARYTIS